MPSSVCLGWVDLVLCWSHGIRCSRSRFRETMRWTNDKRRDRDKHHEATTTTRRRLSFIGPCLFESQQESYESWKHNLSPDLSLGMYTTYIMIAIQGELASQSRSRVFWDVLAKHTSFSSSSPRQLGRNSRHSRYKD